MSSQQPSKRGLSKALVTQLLIMAGAVGLVAFAFWAWHGAITAGIRGIMASASWKAFFLLAIVAGVLFVVYTVTSRNGKRRAAVLTAAWIAVSLSVLALLVGPSVGGYYRGTVVAASATTTDKAQASYNWRTPWTVASASASSRAGNVVGDFHPEATTYLPALGQYVTPVQARGFTSGLSTVVVQDASRSIATTCTFTSEAPVSGGMLGANLSRAVSFLDPGLEFNADDAWVYCDGKTAKLVIPVIRMVGQPEATPVPGGVVIYDGAHGTLVTNVKPGELPGPVYPSSLAAAQRSSLSTSQGLMDSLFSRAGYETTEDVDGDPNNGNTTEILLARTDGSGYDYVTPLTPRGKSFTVTAVATVPADYVTAGELNPLTVHTLAAAREGNQAIADRVKAAFPQLGWAAGLQIVEVVPTSAGVWEATLSNGRAVANRIAINDDGTMCLKSATGKQLSCVAADGAAQAPTNATGATGSVAGSSDLATMSDSELAQLALDVASEQLRRAQAGQ